MKQFYIALILLFMGILTNRYLSHGEAYPLKKAPLAEFPTTLSDWKGVEIGLEPSVLTMLGATEVLMRRYIVNPASNDSDMGSVNLWSRPAIWLYISYYKSLREGQIYHSPKNCLPGSGWQIVKLERISIPAGSNKHIINKVIIQKGLDKEMVLYWYQDRGRVIASEYWGKIYMLYDAITSNRTDGAMIRISAPVVASEERTLQYMAGFVKEVFLHLGEYIPGQQS